MPTLTSPGHPAIPFLLRCLRSQSKTLVPKAIAAMCAIGPAVRPELCRFIDRTKSKRQKMLAGRALELIDVGEGQSDRPFHFVMDAVLAGIRILSDHLDLQLISVIVELGQPAVDRTLSEAICQRNSPRFCCRLLQVLRTVGIPATFERSTQLMALASNKSQAVRDLVVPLLAAMQVQMTRDLVSGVTGVEKVQATKTNMRVCDDSSEIDAA
jgi:hypothetical protein